MDKEILKEIHRLVAAFGSSRDTASREVLQSLCEIASRHPLSVVTRVVSRFIVGEIEGQSVEFPPKPPRFGAALKAEPLMPGDPGYQSREDYLRQFLPAPRHEEPSQESKDRVSKLISDFRRGANFISEKEGTIR